MLQKRCLLFEDKIGKLYSELDMVKMNVRVMSAILKENVPGSENPEDMELLQKLYKTCRVMQERIMELLGTVQNEDVVAELIQVNENLNNVLLGHEREIRTCGLLDKHGISPRVWEVKGNQPSAPSCDLLDLGSNFPASVPLLAGASSVALQPSELSNSKNITTPPNYYELIEFDPLAPSDKTEAIYEEIDEHLFKRNVQNKSSC
ncbi:TOM1-like protein 1 [Varanus komodoensis]|nr:TOM1-like protein 1 [Varanus komodoensis]